MILRSVRLLAVLGAAAAAFSPAAAQESTPPVLLDEPALLRAIDRAYPPALRDAGVSGVVRVRMLVTPDGTPADVEVVETSDPRLAAPALRALAGARFRPATSAAGAPVPYRLVIPIRFEAPASGDDDMNPGVRAMLNRDEVLAAIRAEHPPRLRAAGVSGEAMVEVRVSAAGTVERTRAVGASDPAFGPAAERALRVARFGRADSDVVLRIPVRFTLPREAP